MSEWSSLIRILVALLLVGVNGFFVAAEFSLVKIRISRIEQLVIARRLFAKTARWLAERLEQSLSACQLGITMASLALGYVGEPAFEALLRPVLLGIGLTSETVIHAISFIVSFTVITSLHLVVVSKRPRSSPSANPRCCCSGARTAEGLLLVYLSVDDRPERIDGLSSAIHGSGRS